MPELSLNEKVAGYTHAFKFNYADLQTSGFLSTLGAANQRIIGVVPAGAVVDRVTVVNTVAEAGASDLTLDVGVTASDPDEFIDNLDLDALTYATFNTGDAFVGTDSGSQTTSNVVNGYINNASTDKPLYMELNGTVANLTAGEWVIAWRVADFRAGL